MFRHRTSRTGDPHLHTHGLVANIAKADDGIWRTLDGRLLFHHAKTAGFLYQAQLRHELTSRLDIDWTPVKDGIADIVGIGCPVIEEFSERWRQILEHLDGTGFRTARAAQIAMLATRPDKTSPAEASIWRAWEAKAEGIDFEPTSVNALVVGPLKVVTEEGDVERLFEELAGPEGATRNQSTFDRRHVVMGIAEGLPVGAPVALVEDLADEFLRRPHIVALGETKRYTRDVQYSTAELLELEERLVTGALNRDAEEAGVVPVAAVEAAVAARPTMSAEQARMTQRLCLDGSGVAVVAAPAGAGKTFALGVAFEAWQRGQFEVLGAAVAAKAARELERSSGIPSRTLAKLTKELDEGRLRLTPKSVVVIDESGMAGTRALGPILDVAQGAGAKVVLVGDPRQLPEIEAGGMLNALMRRLDPIELAENRRHQEAWERDALAELRAGDVDQALDAFERHGRVISGSDSIEVRQQMVDDWWAARGAGKEAAMVALRRSDVDDLNGRARRHMVAAGQVHGPLLELDERPYQAGDEIVCLRNDYRLGVRNGDRATVERVDPRHRTMRVRLADDVRTLPTDHLDEGHVAHAYATTIHNAQGMTVNRSLVLGTDDLYREAGYVALSRGREANTLYTVGSRDLDEDLTHTHTNPETNRGRRPRARRPVTRELKAPGHRDPRPRPVAGRAA